ncbi:uncharacterized protein EV420DRAFT_1485080 [Desarmillaria tabescens]|uniref:Uncharacterized protein n=1 Tax=Armillaria tabescens TaxID=1929756 RepID=A0AA39JJ32_ARMTA|nr:uncharacterized protein EV420DRAFT_1485080 [Desarmillaria tabescens]KAK0443097.1 hypothetical protein EV420DRAFT_1485080 [Desarmillaria tabescens]
MKDVVSTQLDSDNCNRVNVKRKGRGRPRKSSLSTSNCRTAASENALSVTSAKVAESSLTSIPTTVDATLSCEPLSSVSVSPSDLTSTDNATTDQNLTKGIAEIELLDPLLSHNLANLRPPSPHTNLSTQDTLTSTEEMAPLHTHKRISCLDFVVTPPPAKRVHREQEVAQWIQELEHLNQEVASLAARQAEIMQKLKSAGAMDIPELDSPVDAFACRTRLRALEVEIEAERQKTHEYELVLEDIRRECKAPFIVPSLLDAFIEVAKLTNAAVKL